MAMIARIKPLPVRHKPGERSLQNAYAEKGWMRHPGTWVGLPPLRLPSGKYATGLDENSEEIARLKRINPEEGERVYKETKERRERLEAATGLDLGPKSEYYSGVYGPKYNTDEVASKIKLMDRDNTFNLSDPFEEVKYWWVIQYKDLIASSLLDWEQNNCKPTVQFYIENEAAEAEAVYKKNMTVVDAVRKLTSMNLDTRKKVAKLCGLQYSDNDNELVIYNKLYEFINEGSIKTAKFKGQDSVGVFTRIAEMSSTVMNAKYLVEQALELRIYNKRNGVVYEGENMIAGTEKDLITQLTTGNKQAEYLALEIKVNDKKRLRNDIDGVAFVSSSQVTVQPKKAGRPAVDKQ